MFLPFYKEALAVINKDSRLRCYSNVPTLVKQIKQFFFFKLMFFLIGVMKGFEQKTTAYAHPKVMVNAAYEKQKLRLIRQSW